MLAIIAFTDPARGFTVSLRGGATARQTPVAVAVEHARSTSEPDEPQSPVPPAPLLEDRDDSQEGPEAATDLLGNDLAHAVASYKLDGTGVLYEEHSPRTEIPRLRPKKS
jgi:hypothetical protein